MSKFNKSNQKSKWDVLLSEAGDEIYVGIDVHKKSYHIAVWKNGLLAGNWVIPSNDKELAKRLSVAGSALKKVVYEAGCKGYGLARLLLRSELPCGVVAPGKTPQEANRGSKSDSLDCRKLAEYAAKDMLKYVVPPTEEEDVERQLVRMRDDIKKKRKRIMQQIKSFLLYNSISEPEGLKNWTLASIDSLKTIKLSHYLRLRLDELLKEFEYYNAAMKRLEGELKGYEKEHTEKMDILESHPGVGNKTARQFLAEIYQPERFSNSKQVTCYLGLAPKISQSGEKRREGGVIKSGREALRSMMVEVCWVWIRKDKVAHQRYLRYCMNTGSAKKAIHAMARCLATNLWNMLMKKEEYKVAA